jgi:LuxR family transcriptional regulator, glucitol operon activator
MSFVLGNTLRSEGAYERAVSLSNDYAPLRYFYAGFLLRIDEPERAVTQLEAAASLDDKEPSIKIQLARAYIRMRNFEAGENELNKLTLDELSFKAKKLWIENWFQLFLTRLNVAMSQFDLDSAFSAIQGLNKYMSELDASLLDVKHRSTISRIPNFINRFVTEERGSERSSVAKDLAVLLEDLFLLKSESPSPAERIEVGATLSVGQRAGTIKSVVREKKFGFIREDNGSEWFFHRNHLRQASQFESIDEGDRVLFEIGENDQGPCAAAIERLSR